MKRLLRVLLAAGLLISGCQKSALPQPLFPLEAEAVNSALAQTGLPGAIFETEEHDYAEGHRAYTLRDASKAYSDGSKAITAWVASGLVEGERYLTVIFLSGPDEPAALPFVWADWKQHFIFAALLFGGFTDEEEIYRAFSGQEPPEVESFEWEAQLSGGYCRVRYVWRTSQAASAMPGPSTDAGAYIVTVRIYASKALYEKEQREAVKAKETLEPRQ